MKAPRVDRCQAVLERFYSLALRLYPPTFRDQYVEEMRVVFRMRLEDAAGAGRGSLLRLAFQEALTLPSGAAAAHARARSGYHFLSIFLDLFTVLLERGFKMNFRQLFPKQTGQTPWLTAILSLLLFLIVGPLTTLVSYHPWWQPEQMAWITTARPLIILGLINLGFVIGVVKRFPRWSYLYSLWFLIALPLGLITLIDQRLFRINYDYVGWTFLLLILLLAAAGRYVRFLRPFFENIRQDWTLLSYALYAFVLILLASTDKDESPVYNLQVQMPSLIAWLGALAYLRFKDPLAKVEALLAGTLLGISIWWLPVFSGNSGSIMGFIVMTGMLLFYWVILAGLLLSPILINAVFRPSRKPAS